MAAPVTLKEPRPRPAEALALVGWARNAGVDCDPAHATVAAARRQLLDELARWLRSLITNARRAIDAKSWETRAIRPRSNRAAKGGC